MSETSHVPFFPLPLLWFWFRRILPVWFGIALLIFLVQIAVAGVVHDNDKVKAMLYLIDLFPAIKTALGGEALRMGNVPGLLAIGYNHPFVLFLFMLFAVGTPTGLLAGEVQKGTMELILSRCVTKTHVYICAGILTVAGMFALVMAMFFGTVAATHLYDFPQPVPLNMFFRIAINGGLLASTFGAFALLCAATFARLYAAIAASVAFLAANYFISLFAMWWPRLAPLKKCTLFYFVEGSKFWQGWPIHNMVVLTAVMLAASVAGWIVWRRRDLPL
jgi:ABC-2 type transport system permease protein